MFAELDILLYFVLHCYFILTINFVWSAFKAVQSRRPNNLGIAGIVPCPTTVSSRSQCWPVFPGFYYGKAQWYPGLPRWRLGYDPVFAGIENDSNRGEPGCHRGEPGRHWGKPRYTVAKYLKSPHPGGVPVKPDVVPITHGLRRIIPVYPCVAPVLPGFESSPGSPLFLSFIVLNILIQP